MQSHVDNDIQQTSKYTDVYYLTWCFQLTFLTKSKIILKIHSFVEFSRSETWSPCFHYLRMKETIKWISRLSCRKLNSLPFSCEFSSESFGYESISNIFCWEKSLQSKWLQIKSKAIKIPFILKIQLFSLLLRQNQQIKKTVLSKHNQFLLIEWHAKFFFFSTVFNPTWTCVDSIRPLGCFLSFFFNL